MRYWGRMGIIVLVLYYPLTLARAADAPSLPIVLANDNRTPVGQLRNGVLKLQLELRQGRWYPEDEKAGYRDVYAFAEQGRAPQSSGPLIRVPQGTQIQATIRNLLPSPATIYGLHQHPGDLKDAVSLQPGETRELQFPAGEPGTYLYWATTSGQPLEHRVGAESLLSGAFVVDSAGPMPQDRIFVIGLWIPDSNSAETIPFINGKSWPFTERVTYRVGDTIRWRVLNPSFDPHAMHLHGFFFTVTGVGDGERYQRYSEEQRRSGVTELIDPGHVFEMTWLPQRAGNWLFHCHMLTHMSVVAALHPRQVQPAGYTMMHDQSGGMGGLVIGITVLPSADTEPVPAVASPPHKLQLVISENPDKVPLYKIEVNDPLAPPAPNKKKEPSLLGPPILLTRGQEAEIEVKNLTTAPTVIHWHGIELESYYDGVAGWTGTGRQTTPAIAPGTSFVARMAPPRAGTFIYHTHWHDETQLLNGIYGPLIVLQPEQKYDPEHDRTYVFSTGRYAPFGEMLLVNGSPEPAPATLHTGVRYRLRFINITSDESDLRVRLVRTGVPVQWTVVAKDGADLPPAQLRSSAADLRVPVGSTCDVEYQADRDGYVEMQVSARLFEALVMQPLTFVSGK